jgi:hypothetical protein
MGKIIFNIFPLLKIIFSFKNYPYPGKQIYQDKFKLQILNKFQQLLGNLLLNRLWSKGLKIFSKSVLKNNIKSKKIQNLFDKKL